MQNSAIWAILSLLSRHGGMCRPLGRGILGGGAVTSPIYVQLAPPQPKNIISAKRPQDILTITALNLVNFLWVIGEKKKLKKNPKYQFFFTVFQNFRGSPWKHLAPSLYVRLLPGFHFALPQILQLPWHPWPLQSLEGGGRVCPPPFEATCDIWLVWKLIF